MALPALTLPFTDADLTGANVIFFYVGINSYTATIPVTSSTKLYPYKTTGAGVADSLPEVVKDALNTAVGSAVFTLSEHTAGLPGRVKLTSSDPFAVSLQWTHATTTFDGTWLGYDTSSNTTATGDIVADWPQARLFLYQRASWTPAIPRTRTVVGAQTYSGQSEVRLLSAGAKTYRYRALSLSPARVLLWAAADADWSAVVPDLQAGDPNTPFEALWAYLGIRQPLRLHPDRDTDSSYVTLTVTNLEALADLLQVCTDPHDAASNPLMDINLECTGYVS